MGIVIETLSSVQFDIMRATEVLQSKGAATIDSQTFIIEHQIDSAGTVNPDERIYTDAIFQYLTGASSIKNGSNDKIITPSSTESVPKSFFYVVRNGLGPLREGSEEEAENFYNFYVETANDYNSGTFRVIMIVALIVLLISDMILIPIVFQVHKTNDRVLAFFGYIPISEISELAAKCEQYMQNYIEDHKANKDFSYESEEEIENSRAQNADNSYLDQSQSHSQNPDEVVEGDSVNPETSMHLDVSERIEASPVTDFQNRQNTLNVPNSSQRKPTGKTTNGVSETSAMNVKTNAFNSPETSKIQLNKSHGNKEDGKRTPKEEDRRREEELDLEIANDRSTKLLNSRNNRRASVVIQFVIIAAIFGVYFLVDYIVVELEFLDNVKKSLEHMKLTSERMPMIKYIQAFTLEEISTPNLTALYAFPLDKTYTRTNSK